MINLLPMPTIATFRSWKIALRNEVAGASGDPDNGFKWITEVKGQGVNLAHMYESAPFQTLDAKLAASLEYMRWILDSGSGFDLISGQSLTVADRRMITKTDIPRRMATANGITTAEEQLSVHVDGINSAVDAVILDNSPCNVLSVGKPCMEKGFGFEWNPGEPPRLSLPDGST